MLVLMGLLLLVIVVFVVMELLVMVVCGGIAVERLMLMVMMMQLRCWEATAVLKVGDQALGELGLPVRRRSVV